MFCQGDSADSASQCLKTEIQLTHLVNREWAVIAPATMTLRRGIAMETTLLFLVSGLVLIIFQVAIKTRKLGRIETTIPT